MDLNVVYGRALAAVRKPLNANLILRTGRHASDQICLRLMPVTGGSPRVIAYVSRWQGTIIVRVIAYVYGGQDTINEPSWSPDSRKVAFISNTDIR